MCNIGQFWIMDLTCTEYKLPADPLFIKYILADNIKNDFLYTFVNFLLWGVLILYKLTPFCTLWKCNFS